MGVKGLLKELSGGDMEDQRVGFLTLPIDIDTGTLSAPSGIRRRTVQRGEIRSRRPQIPAEDHLDVRNRITGVRGGVPEEGRREERVAVVVGCDGVVVGWVFRLARDGGQESESQAYEGEGLCVEKESFKEGKSGCHRRCATWGRVQWGRPAEGEGSDSRSLGEGRAWACPWGRAQPRPEQ
jgi:hypothetical protein